MDMKAEEFIKELISKYDNPSFEPNAEWWDCVFDAHAHGFDDGVKVIIDQLKTFNTTDE
jgi:hypothetical protein